MREIAQPRGVSIEAEPPGAAPAPHASVPRRAASPPAGSGGIPRWLLLFPLALLVVNLAGLSYYLSPLGARLRHPSHHWLKPSGYVGQTLGILALVLFLALWLYPLRKKMGSRAAFTGTVAGWLSWHVAFGLMVPWLAATHAGWRFTGLIGLGYGAMFVVYLSGIVGRYLYVRIPRKRDGLELSRDDAAAERERLLFELTAATGLPPMQVREMLAPGTGPRPGFGIAGAVARMISDDIARHRAARSLARRLSRRRDGDPAPLDPARLAEVLRLARREMALDQQVRMLDATHRALRHWHIFHKPLAITALIAVVAHVAVAVLFGATWLG